MVKCNSTNTNCTANTPIVNCLLVCSNIANTLVEFGRSRRFIMKPPPAKPMPSWLAMTEFLLLATRLFTAAFGVRFRLSDPNDEIGCLPRRCKSSCFYTQTSHFSKRTTLLADYVIRIIDD